MAAPEGMPRSIMMGVGATGSGRRWRAGKRSSFETIGSTGHGSFDSRSLPLGTHANRSLPTTFDSSQLAGRLMRGQST